MIRFEQVSKVYPGGQKALTDVNFHLKRGEMAFLTGHSGAGKSTLLKLITVIERANAGRVSIKLASFALEASSLSSLGLNANKI